MKETRPMCTAPWNNIHIHPTGAVLPCCMAQTVDDTVFLTDDNLDNYSLGSNLARIRSSLLKGELPKDCQSCKDMEKENLQSYRKDFNKKFKAIDKSYKYNINDPLDLFHIDLTFSNSCPLSCSFCGPWCSSKWAIDLSDNSNFIMTKEIEDHYYYANDSYKSFFLDQNLAQDLVKSSPNLKIIEIKGGEPFVSSEHFNFLEFLVTEGYSQNITLSYVTSGLFDIKKYIFLFRHFNEIKFTISADGTGEIYQYIRGGIHKIDKILETAKSLSSLTNVDRQIAFTFCAINIFEIQPFYDWKNSQPVLDNFTLIPVRKLISPEALAIENLNQKKIEKALSLILDNKSDYLDSARKVLSESIKNAPLEDNPSFHNYITSLHSIEKPEYSKNLYNIEPRLKK